MGSWPTRNGWRASRPLGSTPSANCTGMPKYAFSMPVPVGPKGPADRRSMTARSIGRICPASTMSPSKTSFISTPRSSTMSSSTTRYASSSCSNSAKANRMTNRWSTRLQVRRPIISMSAFCIVFVPCAAGTGSSEKKSPFYQQLREYGRIAAQNVPTVLDITALKKLRESRKWLLPRFLYPPSRLTPPSVHHRLLNNIRHRRIGQVSSGHRSSIRHRRHYSLRLSILLTFFLLRCGRRKGLAVV